jgi:hypothetical protein
MHKTNIIKINNIDDAEDNIMKEFKTAFKSRISSYMIKNVNNNDLEINFFFKLIHENLVKLIKNKLSEFNQLKINLELFANYILPTKEAREIKSFNTKNKIFTLSTNLNEELEQMYEIMKTKMSEFAEKDSGK